MRAPRHCRRDPEIAPRPPVVVLAPLPRGIDQLADRVDAPRGVDLYVRRSRRREAEPVLVAPDLQLALRHRPGSNPCGFLLAVAVIVCPGRRRILARQNQDATVGRGQKVIRNRTRKRVHGSRCAVPLRDGSGQAGVLAGTETLFRLRVMYGPQPSRPRGLKIRAETTKVFQHAHSRRRERLPV